jgi:hypothetical protein
MKCLLLILFISTFSYSQSITKQVIGSAGKSYSNSNIKLSFTVGEPVVGIMTSSGNQLGNGYHSALNLQTLSIEDNTMDVQIKVYPNPTSEMLYVSHPQLISFTIIITDLNGRQIHEATIGKEEALDISNYSKGVYIINIESKELNKKNTYKIIKN